ncbi:MAG: monooxygenase [Ilumatobacteraceae bacterium]|nr:monooxygenase [Ilumatobacteraceae bacterium]
MSNTTDQRSAPLPAERFAHLNVFVAGYGYHESSWKVADVAVPGMLGLDHFVDVARTAERGVVDSLFFADSPGVAEFRPRFMAQSGFDPIDLLAALAAVTEHVGLAATASTTYTQPWDLARRFATLDHLSRGRAGWNIVTTGSPYAAANFPEQVHPPHAERYDRAEEFVEVVLKVWDGWEDDAVLASRATGTWADGAKLHAPHHVGPHFSVAGFLPIARSPQGHPVLAQAGSSPAGVALAGKHADLVFTPQSNIEQSLAFRERVRAEAASNGRSPDAIRLLPGLSFVLGSTEAEAEAGWRRLEEASSEEFRLLNLLHIAGVHADTTGEFDPDGPFPYHVFDRATSTTFAEAVCTAARAGNLTFRQAAAKFATLPGGLHFTGTPDGLADLIETWWRAGAADGFTLQPLRLPMDLALFADHVTPILQHRGVIQPGYREGTLRDKLGLPRPPGRRS